MLAQFSWLMPSTRRTPLGPHDGTSLSSVLPRPCAPAAGPSNLDADLTGPPKLTCIICAYNEAPRIGGVLSVASVHPLLAEVIVVDDGSSDRTADIVRSFPSVQLMSLPERRGKSGAFAEGVRAARHDFIMHLDADLKDLTAENITALAEPVLSRGYGMSISVRKNSLAIYRWLGLDFVSGERVMARQIVASRLSDIDELPPFGLEAYINARIIDERLGIAVVAFDNVLNTRKAAKIGLWRGTLADWMTALDVLRVLSPLEVVRQNYRMLSLARSRRGPGSS
jgi:glycosyltransferase involved in cell wall biosynthesis